jgi:hypothetical protein
MHWAQQFAPAEIGAKNACEGSMHAKDQVLHYDTTIRECLIVRPDPGLLLLA